jgi:hypothetical protein
MKTRTDWKFRVKNLALIPDPYWMLDEVQIGKDVRGGVREISGIEIYSEQTPI